MPGFRILTRRVLFFVLLMTAMFGAPAFAQQGPASVFVDSVRPMDFSNRIEAIGTLDANERVDLTVNVADRVTDIYFEDGQRVRAGQTLLSLLQGQQAALVAGAVATVEEAQAVVDRMQPLLEDGGVSRVAYEEAQRNLTVAKTQLTALRIEKNERVLVAPFAGLLGFRTVSVGTYLRPGDVVATLIDDSVMKLDFDVPSLFLSQLSPGTEVEALSEDHPGEVFRGQIESINNQINRITRSVTVRAIIPNEGLKLRPGTFMNVTVNAAPSQALGLREEAVQPRGPKTFVFVVQEDNGRKLAQRREVELGRRQTGYIEVLSGLEPGDMVITEGVIRVRDGGDVVIRNEDMVLSGGGGARSVTLDETRAN